MTHRFGVVGSILVGGLIGLLVENSAALGETPPKQESDASRANDPSPSQGSQATIESANAEESLSRQKLRADVGDSIQSARAMRDAGQFQSALATLRSAQRLVKSSAALNGNDQDSLDRRIQTEILATVRSEEAQTQQTTESIHREMILQGQGRSTSDLDHNQRTASSLFAQFQRLMNEGQVSSMAPETVADSAKNFAAADQLARQSQALLPTSPEPRVGSFVARSSGFLAQSLALEQSKEYRFLETMQDATRASVPVADADTITYPAAETWRIRSESRLQRYGTSVDLKKRDPRTQQVLAKLEEPITVSFPQETPLEEVLKYIKLATTDKDNKSLPIYVDPVGLQEADRTLSSTVSIDLEGVPLKTSLRLLLKQLGLAYTVNEGLVTITSEDSLDTPMETRVYPVADLAIIPSSLMGNRNVGGGGAMGGNFGSGPGGMSGNGLNGGFR